MCCRCSTTCSRIARWHSTMAPSSPPRCHQTCHPTSPPRRHPARLRGRACCGATRASWSSVSACRNQPTQATHSTPRCVLASRAAGSAQILARRRSPKCAHRLPRSRRQSRRPSWRRSMHYGCARQQGSGSLQSGQLRTGGATLPSSCSPQLSPTVDHHRPTHTHGLTHRPPTSTKQPTPVNRVQAAASPILPTARAARDGKASCGFP